MWFLVSEWKFLPQTIFLTMSSSSMMAFKFVDVKTNKEYHLKPGKQLIGILEEFVCLRIRQLPRLKIVDIVL